MSAPFLPLVTVIIPAYNAEKTLVDTLQSVSNQTYERLEILVVDDGSRDKTYELASDYRLKDPRVRVLRQENGGVARARNHGIHEATGSYIAPIDADDLWHPRKIELQVQALRSFPEGRGVAYNWYVAIDANDLIFNHSRPVLHKGDVFEIMARENFIGNGSTPLMPRADVLACGGYDPALRDQEAEGCEDLKLYLALAESLPFAVVPGFLTGYRFTQGNMSSNAYRMLKSHALVMAEVKKRHPRLAAIVSVAEFDMARWYFKRAISSGDQDQVRKLALMLARRFSAKLAVYGTRLVWYAAKQQARRLANRSPKAPIPSGPAISIAFPESGTSFHDRFKVAVIGEAGEFTTLRAGDA
ncbi:glycosyltransferase involved in cell wall biosynthesis [Rhizobium sp. BK529]|uniref:glycosyltransferase family 2 protein n=1 Tax=unclassified Rhizobium TaxID=2613769 RepID=UPI00104C5B8D|nr:MULTISPECIES: glycosyltransferase family 2 protein [unclassified Rhizobium]MBB3595804.1 glycosyltransferase involved in cell wall biosynthesis [Rhizobium sp. BK529]TCR95171.1 glycosyl transferase family 2 [Rhizobium sp. BK418]